MKDQSGVLIGVCRPLPDVLGFVVPVFRDRTGEPVGQIVEDGRVVRFVQLDLGEEFVPLKSFATVSVGDPALYGMEFEDCITVGSPMNAMTQDSRGVADWSDENAIRAAFENNRYDESSGFLTFPLTLKPRRSLGSKLAACAALLCLGVLLAFAARNYMMPEGGIETPADKWEPMTLEDGTAVRVDALSKVEVEFTDRSRIAHLLEGSGVFDVAKDPKRPFIVRTQLVDVTAVGTRFGVSIDSDVTITVAEGTVSVARRGRADGETTLVNAGEEVRVSDHSPTPPRVEHVDAERKLEWATGWLTLSGLTVAQGVEKLNSHNRVQIIVDSPSLSTQVVDAARVRVNSPKTYANAVAEEHGATMTVDEKNGLIRLSE